VDPSNPNPIASALSRWKISLATAENVVAVYKLDWCVIIGARGEELHYVPWGTTPDNQNKAAAWISMIAQIRQMQLDGEGFVRESMMRAAAEAFNDLSLRMQRAAQRLEAIKLPNVEGADELKSLLDELRGIEAKQGAEDGRGTPESGGADGQPGRLPDGG
jgi:hypothetical protein